MKGLPKNYTFSVAGKTITLTDITTVRLDKLALITDTTTNKILYNFADSTVATATVATNVITLSVLQGGEANSDKLRIDYDVESSDTAAFADTVQPVSSTTLATSAKQPALGTAGTSSADVITVQGRAAMTPLLTDGSATTQPVSGTLTAVTTVTNVSQQGGVAISLNTGVRDTGTQRVTIATNDSVPVTIATAPVLVAGSALIGKVSIDQVTANANEVVTKTGSVTAATLNAETTKVIGAINVAAGQTLATVTTVGAVTAITNALPTGTNAIGLVSHKQITTSTLSNVAGSATSVTVLASNANRRMATVYNDSTVILYLKLGATASTTSHTIQMAANSYYELPTPVYTGVIDGIWASATGSARVTEMV